MKKNYEVYSKICACCGAETEKHDICLNCGWQDDNVQNSDPDYRGGANKMSLNEAKAAYRKGKKIV